MTITENTTSTDLPVVRFAHWLIRLPLAAVFLYHGLPKLMNIAAGAEAMGMPVFIWSLVALGEVGAGLGLLAGGALLNRLGDLLTRAAGAIIAIIMTGAIILVHLGPWSGMEFQVLMLGAGVFFALRGNQA